MNTTMKLFVLMLGISFGHQAMAQWWAPWRVPPVRGVPRVPFAEEMVKSAEAIIKRNVAENEAMQGLNKADKLQVDKLMKENPQNPGEIGRVLQRMGDRQKQIKENEKYIKDNQDTIGNLMRPEA